MIIEKKEFYCPRCGGIKTLIKDEKEPKWCPFCGVDEWGKGHWPKQWVKTGTGK